MEIFNFLPGLIHYCTELHAGYRLDSPDVSNEKYIEFLLNKFFKSIIYSNSNYLKISFGKLAYFIHLLYIYILMKCYYSKFKINVNTDKQLFKLLFSRI